MKRTLIIAVLMLLIVQLSAKTNFDKEMDRFIDNLMSKMTLQEKIGQLNLVTPGGGILTGSVVSTDVEQKLKAGNVGGIFGIAGAERIGKAQKLVVEESRLGIPLLIGSDVIHGYKTTFPIPLGLSCSWDMDLIERTAQVAAKEATADGVFWNFSPMVDIARDPRWGRIAEGAGEDPYLGSEVAKAMVNGYQQNDLSSPYTMMATVKHFALYGASEAGRDYNTVDMSRLRMYNEYFPPYKAALDAGAGCVMSSFNDVEGVPASGNKWLLTDILRKEWGFNGFVVSDYTSVNEMIAHGLGDLQAVSALSVKAGLDMDMVGEGFLTTLEKSLKEEKVEENDIDRACRGILEAKYKLGLFEDPYRYVNAERAKRDILTAEHRELAREAAAKAAVLLKNENQVLPIKKSTKIALVGPLADSQNNMLGTWAPTGEHKYAVKVIDGFKNQIKNEKDLVYAKGANIIDDPEYAKKVNVFGKKVNIDDRSPAEMIEEAVKAANSADVIIAVVGEASEMSGESSNRTNLLLPESQKKLLRALSNTDKPLVVILMSGRPLAITEELELADAVLLTWHPGVEAGNAIADLVYGNYNPSGKLTATFPRNVGQVPIHYRMKNTGRPQTGDSFEKFKSNYLDVENSPLLPFGYGLSYTTFEYSNLRIDKNSITDKETLTVSIDVKNTGNYDGEEIVQLYIRDVVASVTRPLKELKGFQKIRIKKGESKTVSFDISENELKFYNNNLEFLSEPGTFKIHVGSNSIDNLKTSFTLSHFVVNKIEP